ncbi:MAG: prepilin-type N-terminal cleavage/methylation domain-containing protein [Bryobacteraceae bacterium]
MRERSRAGVTLMELLIAVSLVGLLSAAVLTSLRAGLTAMEKTNKVVDTSRRTLGVERILEQQVAGLIPVPHRQRMYFQGEPSSMRLISSYSLEEAARGYARILDYQVIPGEEGRGVRLVVTEHLYSGPRSIDDLGAAPAAPGPRSFVLADKLDHCRLSYLEAPPPPYPRRWVTQWTQPSLPLAVRFEMAPRFGAITLPVRVNRSPHLFYFYAQ